MGIIFLIPFVFAIIIIYLHYKKNKIIVDFFNTEKGEKIKFAFWVYFWLFFIIGTLIEARFI